MPIQVSGQIGPGSASDGVIGAPIRQGKTGDLVVTQLHGQYYESNYRQKIFWATMTAGVIFPAPAATVANVCTLANPAGNLSNISIIAFDMVMTVIPTTPLSGLYGLFVNTNPIAAAVTGTAGTPIPGIVGANNQPSAKFFTTSTLPVAPTLLLPFGQKITGAVAGTVPISGLPAFHIEFNGTLILAPGTAITPQQTVADTANATVICSWRWAEYLL